MCCSQGFLDLNKESYCGAKPWGPSVRAESSAPSSGMEENRNVQGWPLRWTGSTNYPGCSSVLAWSPQQLLLTAVGAPAPTLGPVLAPACRCVTSFDFIWTWEFIWTQERSMSGSWVPHFFCTKREVFFYLSHVLPAVKIQKIKKNLALQAVQAFFPCFFIHWFALWFSDPRTLRLREGEVWKIAGIHYLLAVFSPVSRGTHTPFQGWGWDFKQIILPNFSFSSWWL